MLTIVIVTLVLLIFGLLHVRQGRIIERELQRFESMTAKSLNDATLGQLIMMSREIKQLHEGLSEVQQTVQHNLKVSVLHQPR